MTMVRIEMIKIKLAMCVLASLLASCGGGGADPTQDSPPIQLSIKAQPGEQSVVEGDSVSFSVDAVGSGVLTYQWRRDGVPLPGANEKVYVHPAAGAQDDGSMFSVLVTDERTTIASAAAQLRVTGKAFAPSIDVPPGDRSAFDGDMVTFSVTASGTAPLAYAWQRNGVNISGATSALLVLKVSLLDDGAKFRVVVSNGMGSVASPDAMLSVVAVPAAPAVTTQPADQAVTPGQTARFSVAASGTAPLTYQWRRNGTNITGANASAYTTPATTLADSGSVFTVLVSNAVGSATSNPATLTVNPAPIAPAVTTPPANQLVTPGQTASFSVAASGTAPLTYQWRRNGTNITGANASAYTTPATTLADSGSVFTVLVSNAVGSATSNPATLTVNPVPIAPAVTTQPANQLVTPGQTASFSVAASGTAPLTYQWRRNGTNITGANASAYTTPATTLADSGSVFTVLVSNAVGNATSNPATLTVNAAPIAPAVTTQPANQLVTPGQTASFSVAASGTAPLTYQWRRNGTNITGANASAYTTPATTLADNGSVFTVLVSNAAGSASSNAAMLTVAAPTSYLAGLLASIPEGGWVKVNANSFSETWPTGADRAPPTPGGPYQIIPAWSGFAWDARRSNLILFGGGHANYVGNEVYVWQGSDGRWTRGSLPSKVDLSTALVEGNGAPQSAHTYQMNSYAPLVDRFVVFGGAAWNSGGPLVDANGRTGPWWWDPNRANADRAGGQDGTAWDPIRLGSYAWQVRTDFPWFGLPSGEGPNFVGQTSAYREENGQDVLYVTMDMHASGWASLYRYQLGTPTTPGLFQQIGAPSGRSLMTGGAAAIDSRNGLFVRTAVAQPGGAAGDFAVWLLANNNPATPGLNVDVAVQLVTENGTAVDMNTASSIAYDTVNDQFLVWDSRDRGTVWSTRSTFNADGTIAPIWIVRRAPSTTTAQPLGNHQNGVLGKWQYAPELKAFVALDSPPDTGDVWLYKPPTR